MYICISDVKKMRIKEVTCTLYDNRVQTKKFAFCSDGITYQYTIRDNCN